MTDTAEIRTWKLFPSRLLAARRRAGVRQKDLALAAKLDSSALCALERGRRGVPKPEVVKALAAGLKLDTQAQEDLAWAAAHDRVMHTLVDQGLQADVGLVSAALRAARCLTRGELAGLEKRISKSIQSKDYLLDLLADGQGEASPKEDAMT